VLHCAPTAAPVRYNSCTSALQQLHQCATTAAGFIPTAAASQQLRNFAQLKLTKALYKQFHHSVTAAALKSAKAPYQCAIAPTSGYK